MEPFDFASSLLQMAQRMSNAVTLVGGHASRIVQVDFQSGIVMLDEPELRSVCSQAFAEPLASAFAETYLTYAAGGMALDLKRASEGESETEAVPWMVLEDIAYRLGGIPPSIRTHLGIEEAVSESQVSDFLHMRYPALPPDVFSPETSRLLLQNPVAVPFNEPEWPEIEELPSKPPPRQRPTSPPGVVGPPPQTLEIVRLANCLLNGTWTGWWHGWTGWIPGWRLCLDQECADLVADFFLSLTRPGVLDARSVVRSIYTLVEEGMQAFELAVQSAILAFFAIAMIGFALGLNIKLVNGPNGACIYCSWPWTGGIFFWATGR